MLNIISNRAMGRTMGRAAVVAGLLAASVALGQTPEPARIAQKNPFIISQIEFPGGTLGAYVGHLQTEAELGYFNVLYRNGSQLVEIPAIKLRHVHVQTALNSATYGSPLEFAVIDGPFGASVYVFTGEMKPNSTAAAEEKHTTGILPVGDLFVQGSTQLGDLLDAIDVAVFDEKHPYHRPEIRFHEPSGLLIVRGTAAQVATVGDVVDLMSRESIAQRDRARSIASERIEREAEIVDLKVQIRVMDQQFQVEMAKVNRIVELRKQGLSGSREAVEAQLSLVTLALEQEKASNRLRAAEAQLALLDRDEAADRSKKTYELGKISGVVSKLRNALAEIGKLRGLEIKVEQTESELTVNATKEQHAVIAAVIAAMKAAADQSRN